MSFWLPGLFGSLAAAPQQPGWSLSTIYYHTTVSAGADVARAREITIGKIPFILQKTPGALGACGVAPGAGATTFGVTLLRGNSCSPDMSFWEVYTRTQWNPVPQLDIGLEVLWSRRNTAFKGAAVVPANGSRPAVFALDDQDVFSTMFRWQRNFYP